MATKPSLKYSMVPSKEIDMIERTELWEQQLCSHLALLLEPQMLWTVINEGKTTAFSICTY